MGDLWQDLRYAARALRRAPVFTAVAVLTLALGIGANSAIFSVVNALLLSPLPLPRAEQLVVMQMRSRQGFEISVSIPNAQDWRQQARAFSGLAATRTITTNLTGGDRAERIVNEQVLGEYFGTLGVGPALGRAFSAAETERGATPVAVLANGFWKRRFGGASDVIGRSLVLDGRPFTIVGVMPPGVEAFQGSDVFTPLGAFADLPWEQRDNSPGLVVVARRRPGVSFTDAVADMDRVGRQIKAKTGEEAVPVVTDLRKQLLGDVERALFILSAAVGLVLLIACANVANLLLARGEARQRELAVRTALGAARGRIVRQLLTESVVLAALGGLLGLALAAATVRVLRGALPPELTTVVRVDVGGEVLLFTAALVVLTGIVFGLVPALRAARSGVAGTMREGGRGASEGRERQRLRSALVVAEVALAVLLVAGAGLTSRSFAKLRAIDPGFDPTNVIVLRLSPSRDAYAGAERWTGFYDRLLERARAIPGVRVAALSSLVPLRGSSNETHIRAEGMAPDDGQSVLRMESSADYFRAMGITLVRGRGFTDAEAHGSLPVAVIDERMAEKFWPGQDPIGKRVTYERVSETDTTPIWRTVVGVARNVRHYELQSPSRIQVYRPFEQTTRGTPQPLSLFLKTTGDRAAIVAAVRRELAALDPNIPLYGETTMQDVVAKQLGTSRLIGRLLFSFGLLALTLAAVGIYGVMSYTVARRTREIGVRMALGAQGGDVVRLVVGRGGRLAALGVLFGVAGGLMLARLIAGALYGVQPWDPPTFVVAPLVLTLVALAASYLPARRAARLDPALSLQAD